MLVGDVRYGGQAVSWTTEGEVLPWILSENKMANILPSVPTDTQH